MVSKAQPILLAIGNDAALSYLLGRFAERSGYQLMVNAENTSGREIAGIDPAVIVFLSMERFTSDHALLVELANLDMPILVCSAAIEEARARELGADYCLLHPLTYADFEAALTRAISSKRVYPG
jgi:DNA-binding response OmpR family regulator